MSLKNSKIQLKKENEENNGEEDNLSSDNEEIEKKDNNDIEIINSRIKRRILRIIQSILQLRINPELVTMEKVISILQESSMKRKVEDIAILKHYLMGSALINKFKEDDLPITLYDKLASIFAAYFNYQFIQEKCILYKAGYIPSELYIILQGNGIMYSLEKIPTMMTGYEYFLHLIELRDNDRPLTLTKTIDENAHVYPVDMLDINILNLIVFKRMYIENNQMTTAEILNPIGYKTIELKQLFKNAHLDPNKENVNLFSYREDVEEKVMKLISKVNKRLFNYYTFLTDTTNKREVSKFDMNQGTPITTGALIGDNEHEMYIHTIELLPDTHICKINYPIYNDYIITEKRKMFNYELNFLMKNFFFKSISKRKFEFEYFPMFEKDLYTQHTMLFKEKNKVDYIYFIQEGEIDLISHSSILQLHVLINNIKEKIGEKHKVLVDYFKMKNNPRSIENELKEKRVIKLFTFGKREAMGHESFFYSFNHLYGAKVKSERAIIYKIPIQSLLDIFKEEYDAFEDFKTASKKKINIFCNRFNFINSNTLGMIDSSMNILEDPDIVKRASQSIIPLNVHPQLKIKKKKIDRIIKLSLIKKDNDNQNLISNYIKYKPKVDERKPTVKSVSEIVEVKKEGKSYEEYLYSELKKDIDKSRVTLVNSQSEIRLPLEHYMNIKSNSSLSCFMTQVKPVSNKSVIQVDPSLKYYFKKGITYKSPNTINKLAKYAIFNNNSVITNHFNNHNGIFFCPPKLTNSNSGTNYSIESSSIVPSFHTHVYSHHTQMKKQYQNTDYKKLIKHILNEK